MKAYRMGMLYQMKEKGSDPVAIISMTPVYFRKGSFISFCQKT